MNLLAAFRQLQAEAAAEGRPLILTSGLAAAFEAIQGELDGLPLQGHLAAAFERLKGAGGWPALDPSPLMRAAAILTVRCPKGPIWVGEDPHWSTGRTGFGRDQLNPSEN